MLKTDSNVARKYEAIFYQSFFAGMKHLGTDSRLKAKKDLQPFLEEEIGNDKDDGS